MKNRIHSIDFLRGLAALLVVLFHSTHNKGLLAPEGFVYNFFKNGGSIGVDIFFVISGFILPYSMYRSNYSLKRNYKEFFFKRIIRIEPVYILSIIFTIFIFYTCSQLPDEYWKYGDYKVDFTNFILHLGYLISFFGEQNWINPVFWSLGVEFQFYLIIGLIFPVLLIKNKYINSCLSVIMVFFFYAVYSLLIKDTYLQYGSTVLRFIPMFYLGILLFQYKEKLIDKYLLLIVSGLILSICFVEFKLIEVMSLIFAALTILFMKKANGIFLFLGKISFSLYLIHIPLGGIQILFIKEHFDDELTRTLFTFLSILPIIGISYVFYELIERPCMQWSKKIKYTR